MTKNIAAEIESSLYAILPLVAAMEIKVEEARFGYARVSMARHPLIMNHINAFHAGALYTYAETVAAALLSASLDLTRYVVINKRGEIQYKRLVTEKCVAEVTITAEEHKQCVDEIEANGKTQYSCPIVLKNPDGEVAAEVVFDFVIRLLKK